MLFNGDNNLAEPLTRLSYPSHWNTFVASAESFLARVQVDLPLQAVGDGLQIWKGLPAVVPQG